MRLIAISGLPRSGSTLLCNILAQNKALNVSSTSCVPQVIAQSSWLLSTMPEVKSELASDRVATESRVREALRGFVLGWYKDSGDIVCDKSRAWNHNAAILFDLFSDAHLIVCVRDLRSVFASIEKQHAQFPVFDEAQNANERTLYSRADRYFSPEGMIGLPVTGIEDLLRRKPSNTSIIRYETLAASPEDTMRRLYADIGLSWHDHDFTNVVSQATDADHLYLNKFPHDGSGPVRKPDANEWQKFVAPDIASLIMEKFSGYNSAFGYA